MRKVLISLDDNLLERIDHEAAHRKIPRSALIAEFASKELGEFKGPGADPRVHEALRRLDDLFRDTPPGDSTAWIREDRDSRR